MWFRFRKLLPSQMGAAGQNATRRHAAPRGIWSAT
jgi:hypothetical protein